MYSEDDLEQLIGLPFKIYDETQKRWLEDSNDLQIFFDLTDEEKDFLHLNEPEKKVLKSI